MALSSKNNNKDSTTSIKTIVNPLSLFSTSVKNRVLSKRKRKKRNEKLSSISDVLIFGSNTPRVIILRVIGVLFSIGSGAVYPIMAYYFAKVFQGMSSSSPTMDDEYMNNLKDVVYSFLILGSLAFVMMIIQTISLELAASESTTDLKIQWFDALLRQDMAYFDLNNVSSLGTMFSTHTTKYHEGTGKKLGECIQYTTTALGGLVYAFYASWQTSLLSLAAIPFLALSHSIRMTIKRQQTMREKKNDGDIGDILCTTPSLLRTIVSLDTSSSGQLLRNVETTFNETTEIAAIRSSSGLLGIGLSAASPMATYMAGYAVFILYGAFLLYRQVMTNGCDPSGAGGLGDDAVACDVTAMNVFGALMGVSASVMGFLQIGAGVEAFVGAREACYPALMVMRRQVSDGDAVDNDDDDSDATEKMRHRDIESNGAPHVPSSLDQKKFPLPKYIIDSSSSEGKEPETVKADIQFHNVSFSYPTRSGSKIFDRLSFEVTSGQTVAIVGPSGGGKKAIIQLLERFYDPTMGFITFDGVDLRDLNIGWLRRQIGLVSQKPIVFSNMSIRDNIAYGCPNKGCSMEEIKMVAKAAKAHDFIESFPNGYDTQIIMGDDKCELLSEDQKQRIVMAQILLKNPKLLLIDEATTSAFDSEGNNTIQKALDHLYGNDKKCTSIIITNRISSPTIQYADMIIIIDNGGIVEMGTYKDLLSSKDNSEYGHLMMTAADDERRRDSMHDVGLNSQKEATNTDNDKRQKMDNHVVFKDVSFSYPTTTTSSGGRHAMLNKLNLSIKRGETLALIGPRGGGKNTIVDLIERFHNPTTGSIMLNNINIKTQHISHLRHRIGLVTSQPTLFNNMTIRDNIRLGVSPDDDANYADIETAAMRCNVHDYIMSLPRGYDTMAEKIDGSTEMSLLLGRKQQIALARALLKQPEILLLENVTSNLNPESERMVQDAIDNLISPSSSFTATILIIADCLSTVRHADRIAVIDRGSVCEIGTHHDLLSIPHGRYRELNNNSHYSSAANSSKSKSSYGTLLLPNNDNFLSKNDNFSINSNNNSITTTKGDNKKYLAKARSYTIHNNKTLLLTGIIGAILAGIVYPLWGIIFALMVDTLYYPVSHCRHDNCRDYWSNEAHIMRTASFNVMAGWIALAALTLMGHLFLAYGFDNATIRTEQRVRDESFRVALRRRIGMMRRNAIGVSDGETTEGGSTMMNAAATDSEDDRNDKFSLQQPSVVVDMMDHDVVLMSSSLSLMLRMVTMNAASVLLGVVISFVFMWPFALLTLAIVPLLSFGPYIIKAVMRGRSNDSATLITTDDSEQSQPAQHATASHSTTDPTSIVIETLHNITTIASLSIERQRATEHQKALLLANKANDNDSFKTPICNITTTPLFTKTIRSALTLGLVPQWSFGFVFWWGGYVMVHYPALFVGSFRDYLISMFSLMSSVYGMTEVLKDEGINKGEDAVVAATMRIFSFIETMSTMDYDDM